MAKRVIIAIILVTMVITGGYFAVSKWNEKQAKENAKLEEEKKTQDILDMMNKFELNHTIDEDGYCEYTLHMENTTDITFEYFYVDINALDADGNIIGTGSSDQVVSWKPSQKADIEAWVDVENPNDIIGLTYKASYYEEEKS